MQYARYFLQIAYKGTSYQGWQTQVSGDAIQDHIEKAFVQVYTAVKIVGSSRTDAGVHACAQMAHVDLPRVVSVAMLQKQLNGVLPKTISITKIFPVPPETHARYDAISRSYEYHIATARDPFSLDLSYYLPWRLDIDLMNQGASLLLGRQDFASFCKKRPPLPHYYCEVMHAFWERKGDKMVFYIRANRFLHGMVRTIVGTLLEVGRQKLTLADLASIIAAKDRCRARGAAPAQGLFLTEVAYPPYGSMTPM